VDTIIASRQSQVNLGVNKRSAEYKREMVKVLLRRAAQEAFQRAS
jgi:CO/xanthine dehydrogenase FAD-binding subunit